MDKVNTQTPDLVAENIRKIEELFGPNVIVEKEDENGNLVKAVDFDLLRAELGAGSVEGLQERYRLDWPGKKCSILKANTPINKTLRPIKEDSVNWDNTANLYIEGDNFEVLKILQEAYLGEVKMIYIDPPYNTGNDFVYNDDFSEKLEDYKARTEKNEEGYKMAKNTETNGRFHSYWLSMMYERLTIANDLLKNDGVIFISIDDNEVDNLKKIGDEIFGENNFVAIVPRTTSFQRSGQEKYMNVSHDYLVIYSKPNCIDFYNVTERNIDKSKILEDKNGHYIKGDTKAILAAASQGYSEGGDYDFEYNGKIYSPIDSNGKRNRWLRTRDRMQAAADLGILVETGNSIRMQVYLDKIFEVGTNKLVPKDECLKFHTADFMAEEFDNPRGTSELKKLFDGKEFFNNPKPVSLLKYLIKMNCKDGIILDFFSGSATTAQACMELNAEDGGNRKFVMVQLPELCDEKSEAYKSGYKTICDIGKERIRRAGKKIKKETGANIDYGFRVYKVDTSCMKDVEQLPNGYTQKDLMNNVSNIKEDRTPEDLLTRVILSLGLTLDKKIEEKKIGNNNVFYVNGNELIACFDEKIDISIVREIAKNKPSNLVFRDGSFVNDADRINIENILKELSSNTILKII